MSDILRSIWERHKHGRGDAPTGGSLTAYEIADWRRSGVHPRRGTAAVKRLTEIGRAAYGDIAAAYGDKRQARAARKAGDEAAAALLSKYDAAKRAMPAEMPSGAFRSALDDSLDTHSGTALLDIDGLPSAQDAADLRAALGACLEVERAWVTLSGLGAQAIVRVSPNPQAVDGIGVNMRPPVLVARLHSEFAYPAVMDWAKRKFGAGLRKRGLDVDHPDRAQRPIDFQTGTLAHKSAVIYDPDIRTDHIDGAGAIRWDAAAALEEIAARHRQAAALGEGMGDGADFQMSDYRRMLMSIKDPGDRDGYVRVVNAAKRTGLSREDIEAWSAGFYEQGYILRRWDGFDKRRSGDVVDVGTLIHMAIADGYKPPTPLARSSGAADYAPPPQKSAIRRRCSDCGLWRDADLYHEWDRCSPSAPDYAADMDAMVARARASAAAYAPAPDYSLPAAQISEWRSMDDGALAQELAAYRDAGDDECVAEICRIQADRDAAKERMPRTAGGAPHPDLPERKGETS